jgi:hypothetical protein
MKFGISRFSKSIVEDLDRMALDPSKTEEASLSIHGKMQAHRELLGYALHVEDLQAMVVASMREGFSPSQSATHQFAQKLFGVSNELVGAAAEVFFGVIPPMPEPPQPELDAWRSKRTRIKQKFKEKAPR